MALPSQHLYNFLPYNYIIPTHNIVNFRIILNIAPPLCLKKLPLALSFKNTSLFRNSFKQYGLILIRSIENIDFQLVITYKFADFYSFV